MDEIAWYIDPIALCLLALLFVCVVGSLSISSLRMKIVTGKPRNGAVRKRGVELSHAHCECGRRLVVERYCSVCDREVGR
jgi:hypothetical protein